MYFNFEIQRINDVTTLKVIITHNMPQKYTINLIVYKHTTILSAVTLVFEGVCQVVSCIRGCMPGHSLHSRVYARPFLVFVVVCHAISCIRGCMPGRFLHSRVYAMSFLGGDAPVTPLLTYPLLDDIYIHTLHVMLL